MGDSNFREIREISGGIIDLLPVVNILDMALPEQDSWPPEVYMSDTNSGDNLSGQIEPENSQRLNKNYLVSRIREIQDDHISKAYFIFSKLGRVMPELEELDILPCIPKNPNPFDVEQEAEKHEQWWEDHPEEGAEFSSAIQEQAKILNWLYLGATLDKLISELI